MSDGTSIICHFYDDYRGNEPILGSLTQEQLEDGRESTSLKLGNLPVRRGVATVIRGNEDALKLHVQHSGMQWECDTSGSHPLGQIEAGEFLAIRLDITVLYGEATHVQSNGKHTGGLQS